MYWSKNIHRQILELITMFNSINFCKTFAVALLSIQHLPTVTALQLQPLCCFPRKARPTKPERNQTSVWSPETKAKPNKRERRCSTRAQSKPKPVDEPVYTEAKGSMIEGNKSDENSLDDNLTIIQGLENLNRTQNLEGENLAETDTGREVDNENDLVHDGRDFRLD